MAKSRKYRPTGVIYTPVPNKGPDFGDIIGGIMMTVIFFAVIASCAG